MQCTDGCLNHKNNKVFLKSKRASLFGDVGVYAHGDNAREMERMANYGMPPLAVLLSATSVNAYMRGYDKQIAKLKQGLLADTIAVTGNPSKNISSIRQLIMVIKNGIQYKTSATAKNN